MKSIYNFLCVFLFLICCGNYQSTYANNPDYELRRLNYIDFSLANINDNSICIQAYKGVAVDQQVLTNTLHDITVESTADFDIVKLIRVLCFSHGEYDSMILPVLRPIPFWLEKDEDNREYWSENHMIMWMSSDWLLHEKYGKVVDSTLDKRLRHYLQLKVQYGFYEFFSSTYAPYCLSGLLNLADFSQDVEIKNLATQASQRLLKDILLLTNDKGVFFPTAGRNYYGKYEKAYGQNHNDLIYLLTGFGEVPNDISHSGGFLSTTSINLDDVINSWTSTINNTYTFGHTLQDGINNINNTMAKKDKVIFQWSSGAYFHPDVAISTFKLLSDLNLWNHFEFDDFKQFSFLPPDIAPAFAEIASPISKSSGLYNPNISIFKNKSVTLSSLQDFWKGKNGYQQFPIVANVGTSAVFTISGVPSVDWYDRPSIHANTHLPYVKQVDNIALVMYRPEKALGLFGYKDEKLDISLHWQTEKFDEIRENGSWILGREGDGYVAVRRSCNGEINGVRACDNPDGQTWVIIVGNIDMYGSFDAFEQKMIQSQYEEKWYFNLPTLQWVYYSKIVVDGKTLEYAWNGDILSGPTRVVTGISTNKNANDLLLYPNPANKYINVDISKLKDVVGLKIMNEIGQEIYSERNINTRNLKTINTSDWPSGLYIVEIETGSNIVTQKFVVKQ